MASRNQNHRPGDGSTGPKTDAGKEKCSRNATAHGARSEHHVILPSESAEEYQKLCQDYLEDFPPLNDCEKSLFDRLTQRAWHLRRCERLHDEAHMSALLNNPDPREWSQAEIKHIDLMLRYRNAADRAWRAALKDVKDLRQYRLTILNLTEKTKRVYYDNLCDGISRPQNRPKPPDSDSPAEDSPAEDSPAAGSPDGASPRPDVASHKEDASPASGSETSGSRNDSGKPAVPASTTRVWPAAAVRPSLKDIPSRG